MEHNITASGSEAREQARLAGLRVLLTGGGIGGHLSSALAIAQMLRQRHPDAEVLFVGAADRPEATRMPAAGFSFQAISVHGLTGHWTLRGLAKRALGVLEIATAVPVWQSLSVLEQFHPDVVIGIDGYVCWPMLAAARITGYPAILVEQNDEIGRTSRLVSRCIRLAVAVSEESGAFFRTRGIHTEVVGNPVRPDILSTSRQDGMSALGLEPDRLTLSIIGGSRDSATLNKAVIGALRYLAAESWFRDGWQVVHLVGPVCGGGLSGRETRMLELTYWTYPYLENIHHLLAATDMIIARGGGTLLAETAARGIPMVIVPRSGAANDYQARNARPFAEAGAAVVIPDHQLSTQRLLATLNEILPDPGKRAAMGAMCRRLGRPEATVRIVELIEELAREHPRFSQPSR